MAVVKARDQDIDLLARLLRAEAEGEGEQGMLMVGNVGINRIRANCSDFKNLRTIPQMVYQEHAFEAVQHSYFYQKARDRDKRLAKRSVNGERLWPSEFSLWYFRPGGDCPSTWYNQPLVGRWKKHCFYQPTTQECQNIFNTF
ncbi:cell wall hydrolase [Paenibacillus planticolens]|uniref:Cell wall hydrolase n=1 Tax=Paenibacillus planticolens TaxID=2654976 RepID=A0ABX1ZLX5_9BACL|nr:cell wall hydrolase [Paenibacillus planticolens]NOV01090.1 cell wall hydrolase [Paenibacillus planticolens]